MFPAQPNRSLVDGLTVLQALTSAGRPLGSRELARQLALEPTRVNRLLKTLTGLGLARQDAQRKYAPGPGIHVLAAQALYGSGLLKRALPVLEELPVGELIVALGVLWRDQVCYLYHGGPGVATAAALASSGLYPARQSGLGMVLLAQLPERQWPERLPDLGAAETERLRTIRRQGWALVTRPDTTATLAVPLGESEAALGFAGKIAEPHVTKLLPRLQEAAQQIQQEDR